MATEVAAAPVPIPAPGPRPPPVAAGPSLFVGDLSPDVTESTLFNVRELNMILPFNSALLLHSPLLPSLFFY